MACPDCLQRSLLLGELAANIDRAVDRNAGRRARDLLALEDRALAEAVTADRSAAERALEASAAQARSRSLDRRVERAGCWAICSHEDGWPGPLERLGDAAPRALFGRGDRALLAAAVAEPAVTIVGARRCSAYGREVARGLAGELAAAGLVVISGMAFGIDAAAHRGSLETGRCLAVLGSGPERSYPRSAARLYAEICAGGLVLSELPPGSSTFRWCFPARNRLMAALGEMTIVVEAAERSGSLITAEMAADCGRLVGAVPGPVNAWRSSGANRLLLDGAALIRDGADVLDQLLGPGAAAARPAPAALSDEQRRALDAVEAGAETIDAVIEASGLDPTAAASALAELELSGRLISSSGGGYARGMRH